MNSASLRDFAQHCCELVRTAQTNVAKEQLCVWAEEFEEQAAIVARERPAPDERQKIAANWIGG